MTRLTQTRAGAVLALALFAAPAFADGPAWRGDYVGRLEALALLQQLNADLLSHDSATLTLDRWCASHRLAAPAKIVAELDRAEAKPPTDEQRSLLQVGPDEPVAYRHVRLRCGERVLSEAENWYVPSRLTPEMNAALAASDVAFGRAVQALGFRRRTLSAKLAWSPLPDGWEMGAAVPAEEPLRPPRTVIEHRAVLTLPNGVPFSALVENYTDEVLAFPEPGRSGGAQ